MALSEGFTRLLVRNRRRYFHECPKHCRYLTTLKHKTDRYNGVYVDVSQVPEYTPEEQFREALTGLVLREDTTEVLVVQDRKSKFSYWKFPGGLSNLGEDIADTAMREVLEETGVQSEFQSVLALRQQHKQPGAFGRSDFFFVCRMKALTFELNPCQEEISKCEWMELKELNKNSNITSITRRLTELLLHGLDKGFDQVDIPYEEMESVYRGLKYKLFHRPNPRLSKS